MKFTSVHGVLSACLVCLAFLFNGSASASTFQPTDGNLNFITNTLASGTMLSLFDDTDTTYSNGLHVLTGAGSTYVTGQVNITEGGTAPGDYTASSGANSINLADNDWFMLAISTDGETWFGDEGFVDLGSNIYQVTFYDGSVLTIDVTAVPVPAAVWLFGSGLLGLVGIARRKSRQAHA